MAVITISRLIGSGGFKIGKEVAKRLGYKFVDRELIQKIMNQYGLVEFEKVYDEKLSFWDRYSNVTNDMLNMFKRIILSIAKFGNVVLIGQGSFVSLAKYKNVLSVMIHAPINIRVRAIMANEGITNLAKAEEHIIQQDKIRKSFIENNYNIKWNRINNFDMVFNTGKIESSIVIEMIVMAAQALDKNVSISDTLTSNIPDDEILDDALKNLL
jgi:cytidylate kinase